MNPQSWNAYGYVNNNPMNATDPTGMFLSLLPPNNKGEDDDARYGPNDPCLLCPVPRCMLCFGPGGGAPAPEPPPPPAKKITQLPGVLKTKISHVPQTCLAAFDASRAALTRSASQIDFYDGATDKGNLYMFYKPGQYALPKYSFQNVNSETTANATTLFGPNGLPSHNVVVWSNFWNLNNLADQAQTLWHEATHVFTQQGDLELDQKFKIDTTPFGGPNYGASAAYNTWLANGCKERKR
jgi:hypothetical protein